MSIKGKLIFNRSVVAQEIKFYLIMVTPLLCSKLYDYCIKNNLLYEDFDITKVRYSNTFIRNKNISRSELEGIRKSVWEKHFGQNAK